ncbi:hypothetical protein [Cryptosporidium parvum Iowa II]|uniref:Uncharacterized protein n=2 Tax=Cryptosporidium parvum TaxID=5807 RepID=Q5CRR2_CRYPI|nr:hypothetical protein [Cryptosporidium parvum Iowa II]EAK88080.1 hypothetical protein cgd5_1800 [Cryptosporidium parvum Iowa II]QOY41612.1 Uncharacterized protein CPATCC_0023580 [Cryptosporidium parvum]WKS77833.1 hypothetical protein CPCDC_5g1800 [Cryptosporidium sp. 43IA8]WRK32324.1 Uncharacterized protein cpbgf_5001800 [Cryptosporidium parvum]|eukprot:QOY41612.1 hypothetical protein CPATCC_002184 [Cryptosporidium parvum]
MNIQSQIKEINSIDKNSLSYLINSKSTLNGIYHGIESNYFAGHESILNNNSANMRQCQNIERRCENEVWLTLPLFFPSATLHNVTHQRRDLFCESNGGSLCFSPEETNTSRLFSTIQGLSDIGAGFFQIVIAKLKGVVAENVEAIKSEFERIFKNEDSAFNGFIPLKPIGWRKRSFSKENSTILLESNEIIIDAFAKQKSYYNAILISENYTESCKENIIKLGKLSNNFLEKIKLIYPSLEIVKVSDLEKDNFFEVTIRIKPMPSYVSSEGEDFDPKDKKFSMFQNLSQVNNLTSIYLGDIRLIDPYKTEVDLRIPCGLFKTFALISSHSIFVQSRYCMATYVPFSQSRKKKLTQTSHENGTEIATINSKSVNSSQIFDRIQYKISTPKLLTFGNNKETSIKTPPPSNFPTNNSNCVSNISTCDLSYNAIFNSNWGGKSYSCTPTTKESLNKISYTPFSSIEMDSSPWLSADFNIEPNSIFSFEQDNQQLIPPRISSLNYMDNLCNNENNNHSNNNSLDTNFITERQLSYDSIKNFEHNHLQATQKLSNKNQISFVKRAEKCNNIEVQEPVFGIEHNLKKNQTIEIDDKIELLEYECSQYLESKDFDIFNMLENIFSDNSATNFEDCQVGYSDQFSENENINRNSELVESKVNQSLSKNYSEKFGLWSFELYKNSNACITKPNSNLHHKDKTSEFVPNELNYLNEKILFG